MREQNKFNIKEGSAEAFDESIPEDVVKRFHDGELTLGDIGKNLKLANYIKEDNLSDNLRAIYKAIGESDFLLICTDYGEYLENVNLLSDSEISVEKIRETIEQVIYKKIKEDGIEYSEDLPLSFQKRYPDIFLSEDIPKYIRNRFYRGELHYMNIQSNTKITEDLRSKDIDIGFRKIKNYHQLRKNLTKQDIINFSAEYGPYLDFVNPDIYEDKQNIQEKELVLQKYIEENILNEKFPLMYRKAPDFFKKKYPELFLSDDAPDILKDICYVGSYGIGYNKDGNLDSISFEDRKLWLYLMEPEWVKFFEGKDVSRFVPKEYEQVFKSISGYTLLKLWKQKPETVELMLDGNKGDVLETWVKSTGGKFIPHHVVMMNFPGTEIDNFLENIKWWSQLMKIERYNLKDEEKIAILKVAYSMGVFFGNDDGFNKTMELFTGIPKNLSVEEYQKVIQTIGDDEEKKLQFEQAYSINKDGMYGLKINKQKDTQKTRNIRRLLEESNIPRILTPEKAHQMFDSFDMKYNPDFVKFFNENIEEIISNPEYTKGIATIQRQFDDVVRANAGRRLTLDVAQDYVKSIAYANIEIGNEGVAEQAKIAGYPQKDFDEIQNLFNEGEMREFSSIPRIQGEFNGYTYEMLRCDDPLALTIGTLTDCCQEIHGAGQTSMEHSVVSPDGRVFCVRDSEGRIVAQSWFWRNQYTGCFDNIEIPKRIFELYERKHPDEGRAGLTSGVLEVYKKAAQDLMQEDTKVYQELLQNGTITQEQYDSLLLGKVTIGLGYNDIADAIKKDKTIHKESDNVSVKRTDRLKYIYTDAHDQYTIAEREEIVKSEYENLYVYQDEVPVYDENNMSSTVLTTMKRMEQTTGRNNLEDLYENSKEKGLSKSQRTINSIARLYELNPDNTKVMATARMALIYSKDKDKIKIGDLLSSPINPELTEEQKQKAQNHIRYQVKKAIQQMGIQGVEVDLSSLGEEQQLIIQSVMQEIEKENNERGER